MIAYENGLSAANNQMLKNFNSSLLELKPASDAGAAHVHLTAAPALHACCNTCCSSCLHSGVDSLLLGLPDGNLSYACMTA